MTQVDESCDIYEEWFDPFDHISTLVAPIWLVAPQVNILTGLTSEYTQRDSQVNILTGLTSEYTQRDSQVNILTGKRAL